MPEFLFKALDENGAEKKGKLKAENYNDAVEEVKKKGFYPTEVVQKISDKSAKEDSAKKSSFRKLFEPVIKTKHLVPFISDLAVLVDAGLPLTRAMAVLMNQAMTPGLKRIVEELLEDVEGGQHLSEALGKHPRYFSPLFINMVEAGEMGGILSQSLNRLAKMYEKAARLESRMKSALMYPCFILLFALLIVVFIVAFVVPKFFTMFSDIGSELPLPTVILYNTSQILQNYWILILCALFVFSISLKFTFSVRAVRYGFDVLKLKMPVFGSIFTKVSISRFVRTFGTLLASGVPILQTLNVAKTAAGNLVFENLIDSLNDSIKEGEGVAASLTEQNVFPPLVVNMIMVGEETGALSDMLLRIADRYDDEVDVVVSQLTSLLEPFLLVGLGLIVGFIVIALFLPLIAVVQNFTGV